MGVEESKIQEWKQGYLDLLEKGSILLSSWCENTQGGEKTVLAEKRRSNEKNHTRWTGSTDY